MPICCENSIALMPPVLPLDELDEELLDELDELLELEELETGTQAAAEGAFPVMLRKSTFGRPAALVACTRNVLVPACRLTLTVGELTQVVHAPVLAKPRLPTLRPLTSTLAERAVAPFAYLKKSE